MAASTDPVAEKIEWDSRCLHKYSIEQIQNAFSDALKALTGKAFRVEIRSLNRHPEHELSSALFDAVEMTMRAKEDPGPSPF